MNIVKQGFLLKGCLSVQVRIMSCSMMQHAAAAPNHWGYSTCLTLITPACGVPISSALAASCRSCSYLAVYLSFLLLFGGCSPLRKHCWQHGIMFPSSTQGPITSRNRCPTVMHRDLLKYQPEKDPSMPKERTNLDQLVVAPRRLGISGAEMGAVDAWFFDRLQMFQGEWPTNVGLHNLGVSSFLLCIYIYIMHIYKYIYIYTYNILIIFIRKKWTNLCKTGSGLQRPSLHFIPWWYINWYELMSSAGTSPAPQQKWLFVSETSPRYIYIYII